MPPASEPTHPPIALLPPYPLAERAVSPSRRRSVMNPSARSAPTTGRTGQSDRLLAQQPALRDLWQAQGALIRTEVPPYHGAGRQPVATSSAQHRYPWQPAAADPPTGSKKPLPGPARRDDPPPAADPFGSQRGSCDHSPGGLTPPAQRSAGLARQPNPGASRPPVCRRHCRR